MLEPKANVVVTVFPTNHEILVDFAVPIVESIDQMFESLEENNLGIVCFKRNYPDSGIRVMYTRAWDGTEIAKEIRHLINGLGFSSVYCQMEGDFIRSLEIS